MPLSLSKPITPAHAALGRAITAIRSREQLPRRQLARRAGLPRRYLARIERGLEDPTYSDLRAIIDAMDVVLYDLGGKFGNLYYVALPREQQLAPREPYALPDDDVGADDLWNVVELFAQN